MISLRLFLVLAWPLLAHGRYLMYLTGQHPIIPPLSQTSEITHVALAFMRPHIFNSPPPETWPIFSTIDELRPKFHPETKFLVAIGGWGDSKGFEDAAWTEEGREYWAKNVATMVKDMGADGVDIDWEYPGGNGADYRKVPNSAKAWQIAAYPLLLSALRSQLPRPAYVLSAAVPGSPADMLAFTPATLPAILAALDFLNVMTYDLMSRRSPLTAHHSGTAGTLLALRAYAAAGARPAQMNFGYGFYAKWFVTAPGADCCAGGLLATGATGGANGAGGDGGCQGGATPLGCPTALMEDPATGEDLGGSGGFSWHDEVPGDVEGSFARARQGGAWDEVGGGWYYWDRREERWWTWDSAEAVGRKFDEVVGAMAGGEGGDESVGAAGPAAGVGGVFAWGLGEDGEEWAHLDRLTEKVREVGLGRTAKAAAAVGEKLSWDPREKEEL